MKDKLFKHLRYFRHDFRGELWGYLGCRIKLSCLCLISTLWNYMKCGLYDIKVGKGNKFWGNMIFRRHSLSSIKIGSGSQFNNSSRLNQIGVNHPCVISTHSTDALISIGNNCGFSGTTIAAYKKIEIGNNVLCGANTIINDFDWHVERYHSLPKDVVIGNNVWLGVNVVVMKGVTIGDNAIIGANSVVTKDIPANTIAVGNPCKVVKYQN